VAHGHHQYQPSSEIYKLLLSRFPALFFSKFRSYFGNSSSIFKSILSSASTSRDQISELGSWVVHRTKPSNQTPQFAFHTNPNLALLQTSHSTSFSCSVEQHLSLRLAQTAKDSIDSSRQDARTLSYRHIITGLSSFCLQDSFGKCVKAVGTRDIVSWKHGFPHLLIYVSCAFLLFPVLAPQSIGLL
jgi:hypothetical protein